MFFPQASYSTKEDVSSVTHDSLANKDDFCRLRGLAEGLQLRMHAKTVRCVVLFADDQLRPASLACSWLEDQDVLFLSSEGVGVGELFGSGPNEGRIIRRRLAEARRLLEMTRRDVVVPGGRSGAHGRRGAGAGGGGSAPGDAVNGVLVGGGLPHPDVEHVLLDETDIAAAVTELADSIKQEVVMATTSASRKSSVGNSVDNTLVLVGILRAGFFLHADLVRALEDILGML